VTICIFWAVFEFYNFSKDRAFESEVVMIINLALLFFLIRMIQLIGQLNPLFQDFIKFLKKKGIDVSELDEEK
jgi:CDP-diglyceride synthetase